MVDICHFLGCPAPFEWHLTIFGKFVVIWALYPQNEPQILFQCPWRLAQLYVTWPPLPGSHPWESDLEVDTSRKGPHVETIWLVRAWQNHAALGGRPQGCISERHLHQWGKQCWTFSFLRAACHMPLTIVPRSLAPPWATQLTESVCPLWVTALGTAEANREEKPKNLEWLPSGVVNQEWEEVDQETTVFYYKPLFSCWAF